MKNRLTLVTVATHKTHELDRFIESAKYHGYDYVILGLGMEWTGGVADNGRLVFPGGGMKVNLLKEYLSTYVGSNSDVILFTDSYDVVFNEKPDELLSRWDGNVLFTAEKTCWPDRDLEEEYPNSPYGYKYLNSGGFIATVGDLINLTETKCMDHDDDQLYYTLKFLNGDKINLDYNLDIFQTLNQSIDDVEIHNGRVYNKVTKTYPIVIHANGGVGPRTYLNKLYNDMRQPDPKLKQLNGDERVCLQMLFDKKHTNPSIMVESLSYLTYDKRLIDLSFYNNDKENQWAIENYIKNNGDKYNSITQVYDESKGVYELREMSFKESTGYDGDYVLHNDSSFIIKNKDTIQLLMSEGKDIISPMINTEQTFNSNFWGGVSDDGYYLESYDYHDIRTYNKKGTFVVPFISGVIMFSKEILKTDLFSTMFSDLDKEILNYYNEDHMVVLANTIRDKNLFMYITNKRYYGKFFN